MITAALGAVVALQLYTAYRQRRRGACVCHVLALPGVDCPACPLHGPR